MKRISIVTSILAVAGIVMLSLPAPVLAEVESSKIDPPPIGQQLVREGNFAVRLAEVLEVVTTDDEVEAESSLGEIGISPRNGWIADYPVTPDILAELQTAIAAAADADKLNFEKPEALRRLEQVNNEFKLGLRPYSSSEKAAAAPQSGGNYPNPTIINNYYTEQGPPVITYYAPPTDYYYLYSWVPFPFWGFGFWFPGYFILNDFHRVVHFRDRPVFISNHFRDIRNQRHRAFRIDPVARFEGRTYQGIGAVRSRGYISTGVPRSERRIFNGSRTAAPRGATGLSNPQSRSGRSVGAPPRSGAPSVRGNMPSVHSPRAGSAPSNRGGGDGGRSGGGGGGRGGGGVMERR